MPLFSVIIPVYNRHEAARRAVDSVLAQTFGDYELILVDDGSTDDTSRLEEEYRGRIDFIRISHGGVSAARNGGIGRASAPWIAFLDSDDLWLPGKLERQARFIRERPEFLIHQTGETWIRRGRRVNPRRRHLMREGRIFIESLELCLVSPSAVVMARELFARHGLFDEDLPACEDYDLWLRVTKDEAVGLVPEPMVIRHGGHPDQLSSRYWGMDRFRLYSIIKLLERHGNKLPDNYRTAAIETAKGKARILMKGSKKRSREGFADSLGRLMVSIETGRFDVGECRFLLEDEVGAGT
ncbi:MAG: glycosyltransferase [Spirochaetes bacterium]|nr:glycosyltransferase [Spirochaetota bacterium]